MTFDGVHGECCRLNRFAPVTRKVITSLIKFSPAKTCFLDPLPTSLLKKFVGVLSAPITRINASLAAGCFPSSPKHAAVTPLMKKPSMDPDDLGPDSERRLGANLDSAWAPNPDCTQVAIRNQKKIGFATNPNRDWTELLRYLFSGFALVNPDFAIGSSAIRLQFELVVIFVRAVW